MPSLVFHLLVLFCGISTVYADKEEEQRIKKEIVDFVMTELGIKAKNEINGKITGPMQHCISNIKNNNAECKTNNTTQQWCNDSCHQKFHKMFSNVSQETINTFARGGNNAISVKNIKNWLDVNSSDIPSNNQQQAASAQNSNNTCSTQATTTNNNTVPKDIQTQLTSVANDI